MKIISWLDSLYAMDLTINFAILNKTKKEIEDLRKLGESDTLILDGLLLGMKNRLQPPKKLEDLPEV